MKIFYLITKSEVGGAQMHVLQLIRHLKANGHDVALMTKPGGWLEEEAKKINAVFYPNNHLAHSLNPFRAYKAIKRIQSAVSDFSPDILSCHSTVSGFLGRVAIRRKTPTIFTAHSWAFTSGAPLLRKLFAAAIEKIAARYTDHFICVSQYDQRLAQRFRIAPKEKMTVIYNGISIGAMQKHEGTTIVSVGRLAYPKKYKLLLDSIAQVPEATLTIVGSGPDQATIESRIEQLDLGDRVRITGNLSEAEVQRELSSAGVFILLSKHEGLPMSILEAMAASLPIVASSVGGIPELLTKECGVLVSNRADEVASALRHLLADQAKREDLGMHAYRRAKEQFSLDQFLKNTTDVYKRVISEVREIR